MLGYSYTNVFTQFEINFYKRAVELVEKIPERVNNELVRCHEVARVVGTILGLPVTDGKYGSVDHSWCWVSPDLDGERPGNILDVYSIARLPVVQLVGFGIPGVECISNRSLYVPYPFPRKDINQTTVDTIIYIVGCSSKRTLSLREAQVRFDRGEKVEFFSNGQLQAWKVVEIRPDDEMSHLLFRTP